MKLTEPTRRMIVSGVFGLLGVLLLARFADRAAQLSLRPFALMGVLFTACGIAYAAALWISPMRESVRIRHIAAGATAAWLAYLASGMARLLGLSGEADSFRVLWAPVIEELAKASMLAIVWTVADDHRNRREIVAAAVGVGAGFALRENFVYFGEALGAGGIYLEWIVLRAFPPVLAHAAFAMISGGAVAQRVLHARALGQSIPRFSMLGFVVAVLAHATFNFVALVIARDTGSWAVEVSALWSVVAIAAAWLLQRRVIALAALDEPSVTSMVPPLERPERVMSGVLIGVGLCWIAPASALRYLAVVLTPIAFGLTLAFLASRRLKIARVFTPVLLGVLLRPIVHTPELMLVSLMPFVQRHHALRMPMALLGNIVWLAPIACVAFVVTHTRGRSAAVVNAMGVTAGLVGASVGGVLASAPLGHPVRAMLGASLPLVPVALALGTLAGRIAYRSPARLAIACVGVPVIATVLSEIERAAHTPRLRDLTSIAVALAALSTIVLIVATTERAVERERAQVRVASEEIGARDAA